MTNNSLQKCILLLISAATLTTSGALAQEQPTLLSSAERSTHVAPISPILLSFPTALPAPPGRDRFLSTPARSTEELVEALKTNKVFRKNLSRHFGIPESQLIDYVRDALVPSYLEKDTTVTNYGVTKAGMIYGKKTVLKKGMPVWATRSGQPILKWVCSNPLAKTPPPGTTLSRKPKTSVPTASGEASLKTSQLASASAALTDGDFSPIALETPGVPEPLVATEPLTGETVGKKVSAPILPAAAGAIARSGIPLLPLAGAIGFVVRSQALPRSGIQPNAVPEPGTLALLGLGALPLGKLLRRRR